MIILRFLMAVFCVLCLIAPSVYADDKSTEKPVIGAVIVVGPSDVKGYIYKISSGKSEDIKTIRNSRRIGLNYSLEDGLLHTEELSSLADQVSEILKKIDDDVVKENKNDKAIDLNGIAIVVTSNTIINFDRLSEAIKHRIKNLDGLSDIIKNRISTIDIELPSVHDQTLYGFLDSLNFLMPECIKTETIDKSIYINISSSEVSLGYLDGDTFAQYTIPVSGIELSEELRKHNHYTMPISENELSEEELGKHKKNTFNAAISAVLGTDLKLLQVELARKFPGFFDRIKRPNLYITGGTAWAMAGLVASDNKEILELLLPSDKQKAEDKTVCHMESKGNRSLSSGHFLQASRRLEEFIDMEPVSRNDKYKTQLEKQYLGMKFKEELEKIEKREKEINKLGKQDDASKKELEAIKQRNKELLDSRSVREEDVMEQVKTYGYNQDQLLAQLKLADWILELIGRKQCQNQNGKSSECRLNYTNRQDNWLRIYEYQRVHKDIVIEGVRFSKVLENASPPTVLLRSRDMLR